MKVSKIKILHSLLSTKTELNLKITLTLAIMNDKDGSIRTLQNEQNFTIDPLTGLSVPRNLSSNPGMDLIRVLRPEEKRLTIQPDTTTLPIPDDRFDNAAKEISETVTYPDQRDLALASKALQQRSLDIYTEPELAILLDIFEKEVFARRKELWDSVPPISRPSDNLDLLQVQMNGGINADGPKNPEGSPPNGRPLSEREQFFYNLHLIATERIKTDALAPGMGFPIATIGTYGMVSEYYYAAFPKEAVERIEREFSYREITRDLDGQTVRDLFERYK